MMSLDYHQGMRTTLTLDEDVAAKLKAQARKSGKSFKDTVNEFLRLALNMKKSPPGRERFRIKARDLGRLRPGLSLDSVSDLLEQLEGPVYR
jgi:plasmid stability protein